MSMHVRALISALMTPIFSFFSKRRHVDTQICASSSISLSPKFSMRMSGTTRYEFHTTFELGAVMSWCSALLPSALICATVSAISSHESTKTSTTALPASSNIDAKSLFNSASVQAPSFSLDRSDFLDWSNPIRWVDGEGRRRFRIQYKGRDREPDDNIRKKERLF